MKHLFDRVFTMRSRGDGLRQCGESLVNSANQLGDVLGQLRNVVRAYGAVFEIRGNQLRGDGHSLIITHWGRTPEAHYVFTEIAYSELSIMSCHFFASADFHPFQA